MLFEYEFLIREFKVNESYDTLFENKMFYDAKDLNINENDEFDIFLSHSYADRNIIPQLKKALELMGYKVYVDWINDRLLSRENVTKETAEILQKRMKQSKSLFFATSENSPSSKWMPWELGYFDGIKNKRVAILPIKNQDNQFKNDFKGQEYLGLYYYVTLDNAAKSLLGKVYAMEPNYFKEFIKKLQNQTTMYINKDTNSFVHFPDWINGEEPLNEDQKMVMNLNIVEDKLNE